MDPQKQPSYNLADIRKVYPRAGMKWNEGEDQRLKQAYELRRLAGFGDFDLFVSGLTAQFQRAAGGLKARLAMHFNDVPGWDYGRQQLREQQLDSLAEEHLPNDKNDILAREYKKYLETKKETYTGFLRRLSQALGGVEGRFISHRLLQMNGSVAKYRREDVNPYARSERGQANVPVAQLDISGNAEAKQALRTMAETSDNLFLTGEAGTGKSTLLNYFRKTTEKNLVVLAPTGVAALNVEGQTIHSFCAFGPDITLSKVKKLAPWSPKAKLLQKIQTIVIDEISMVRADLLDCVDKFLRINGPMPALPFGGIQMVFIGDLYQLPPVDRDFGVGGLLKQYASPYFFDAKAFKSTGFEFIELKTIYRQKDQLFKDVLNAVRNNAARADHLSILNQRARQGGEKFTFEKFAIYLTPHNAQAKRVNEYFLERISQPLLSYTGTARGKFESRELPTDLNLQIKVGAQVMMLNNDAQRRWVNGTMGKIMGVAQASLPKAKEEFEDFESAGDEPYNPDQDEEVSADRIIIELETGETVYVLPHTWEMFQFVLDSDSQKIDSRATGSFTQYPFKLAWAVTIHKAQGKTFDKVYVDLSTGTFAHGQLYVALSRCRTLEGLFLKRPVMPQDIILDQRIVKFLEGFKSQK